MGVYTAIAAALRPATVTEFAAAIRRRSGYLRSSCRSLRVLIPIARECSAEARWHKRAVAGATPRVEQLSLSRADALATLAAPDCTATDRALVAELYPDLV
jgi:uncharacterized protein (DUF2237 family)